MPILNDLPLPPQVDPHKVIPIIVNELRGTADALSQLEKSELDNEQLTLAVNLYLRLLKM
jgi:hypothetical protein